MLDHMITGLAIVVLFSGLFLILLAQGKTALDGYPDRWGYALAYAGTILFSLVGIVGSLVWLSGGPY